MTVSLNILNVPNCTLTVPMRNGGDPVLEMRHANRRIAQQGAREVSLVPNRTGDGWSRVNASRRSVRKGVN